MAHANRASRSSLRGWIVASIPLVMALALPMTVQGQAPAPAAGPAPDQEELVQFTELYVEVTEIQAEMQAEVAGAQSSDEANAIQEEAVQEIVATMDEHGISEQRYSEIIAVLNQDTELRTEFDAILQDVSQAAPN